ncbi:hypothetical protein AK830_g113 [Neonectria ditissima]|uniref:DUF7580 domain-containing protein n=1 Tax=Neonectria ditissima TaxID=78410 RepID=A0A0P7BZC1_9HYPO|nr:hypothetical protein AK830_g113 [Neonectria ditissima]
MSGIEIAGLVLGAFPVAISVLEKYREVGDRFGFFMNIRREYKECLDDLKFQQLSFTSNLRHLLLPLVVDDDRIAVLLAHPGGESWKERSIGDLLEKRLQGSFELYMTFIERMLSIVKEIQEALAFDSRLVQEKIITPEVLQKTPGRVLSVRSVLSKEGVAFQYYKFKFSNGESARNRLFARFQQENDRLEKILSFSDQDIPLVQQRNSAMQSALIDAAICDFWIQAGRVFQARASAWNCQCQEHEAKLLLQHRASKKSDFYVTFSSSDSSQWGIRKTRIAEEGDPSYDQGRQLGSNHWNRDPETAGISSPRTQAPEDIEMSTFVSVAQPISSLCAALQQTDGSCCGYVLGDNHRYYVYATSCHSAQSMPCLTLGKMLEGGIQPHPTRAQRYNISLILASSFLQLLESPWMMKAFTKTDILFLGDVNDPNIFILDQPHIKKDFSVVGSGSTHSESSKEEASFAEALDHLGILLLELCFGKILEKQPCRKRWPAGGNETEKAGFDVVAARDWQCHVNEEAGLDYADAVGWCLGGNRSALPEKWRQNMLQRVIQPLQRCSNYLKASGVVGV